MDHFSRTERKSLALCIDHHADMIEIYTQARANPLNRHILREIEQLKAIAKHIEPTEESSEGNAGSIMAN